MSFDYRREYYRYRQYYANLKQIYDRPLIRVSFFVLLSFITVAFFSLLAIRPTLKTIGGLVREIEDKERIDEALDRKIATLNLLQGELGSLQEEALLVEAVLPDGPKAEQLLQKLEYLAQLSGVTILAAEIDPEAQEVRESVGTLRLTEVPVALTVGGEFDQVREFLQAVEQLDRLLIVQEAMLLTSAQSLQRRGFSVVAEVDGAALFLELTLPREGADEETS